MLPDPNLAVNVLDFPPCPEVVVPPPGPGLPHPVPDRCIDATGAILRALDSIPPQREIPGLFADRNYGGATLLFPPLPEGAGYVVNERVDVPGDRNVTLRASGPRGARIRLHPAPSGGASPYVFFSRGPRRVHRFEDLVFHGGGVLIESQARGSTDFLSCSFHGIDGWAIATDGRGVVGGRVLNCDFSDTPGGGVGILSTECDNWLIGDNTRFVRMGGIGVESRSPSVTIRQCEFEDKLTGTGEQPYIRLTGDASFVGGQSTVRGCRFGGEVGHIGTVELDGPPRYAIELVPLAPSHTVTGVVIQGNWFFGRIPHEGEQPGPSDHSARAAILVADRVMHCLVTSNFFRRRFYLRGLIEDTNPGDGRVNCFVANAVDLGPDALRLPTRTDIFTGNGEGWEIFP
jgi:hypothetical protein